MYVSQPSGAGLAGSTASEARKQNWNCQRIGRAMGNLIEAMQAKKERAEKEQEQMPQTLSRMFSRFSGPPGGGNAALAEFNEARRDADQLNDLLREKGCSTYDIGVDAPAFIKQ
jgi:histidinol-phosphate/aromatic aminotransferase/cobyric acid decarboxylase-like protein